MKGGLVVDLFAGGGGASTGIEAALGRRVDLAINHSAVALAVHEANHPRTRHLTADLFEVDPRVATRGRRVDVLWASPDCTHHSRAKGGKPRSQKIRSLAHVVVEWARAVRPRVIFVENVAEFLEWGPLGADGLPIKSRKGESFGFWRGALELLGYRVEHRILDASLYGAPTRRRRLFIVARCDGEAITWPEPTHGPGKLPLRTAAECIDWSLLCPSIFERKRPLAEKTLWRIAQGIRRYVLESPEPFIVRYNGTRWRGQDADQPLTTIDCSNRFGLVSPTLVQTGYGERPGQAPRALDLHEPLGTVVACGQKHALAYALLKHYGGVVGQPLEAPTSTITATDHHGLVSVTLQETHEGDRSGSETDRDGSDRGSRRRKRVETAQSEHDAAAATAKARDAGEKRVPGGAREPGTEGVHAVGSPSCVDGAPWTYPQWPGDQPQGRGSAEQRAGEPRGGFTEPEHAALIQGARAEAAEEYPAADSCGCGPASEGSAAPGEELRTDRQGTAREPDNCVPRESLVDHTAEVRAFLTVYFSNDATGGQSAREPLRTITAKHRLGLVTVADVDDLKVDIGMRMLQPHELLKAQFGGFAAGYDLSAARTKAAQIRLIGNSVCPDVVEALVRSNLRRREARAA